MSVKAQNLLLERDMNFPLDELMGLLMHAKIGAPERECDYIAAFAVDYYSTTGY